MSGDYAVSASLRDDLRAAVNPLPIPLQSVAADGTVTNLTSHDYTTAPDRGTGPFFDVSTELWAIVQITPRVYPWVRTGTCSITGDFDPDGDFDLEIGVTTSTYTGAAGQTITQVLDGIGGAAVTSGSASGYRVYDVDTVANTGKVDVFFTDSDEPFVGFSTSTGTAVASAVDPVEINNIWLYGRLNDNVNPDAPTNDVTVNRSGWALFYNYPSNCTVQGSAGADGWSPIVDCRMYRWLLPVVGAVVGVDGDDADALAAGAFRSIRIRPCDFTGKVIP